MLDGDEVFRTYPKEGQMISDLYPTHTLQAYGFRSGQFYNISLDSLQVLFGEAKYTSFHLQGTRSFVYYDEGIEKQQRSLELDFPNMLQLSEVTHDVQVDYIASPTITSKQQQIKQLQKAQLLRQQTYQSNLNHYNSIKAAAEQATDHIEKELLMMQFAKMKLPKDPASASAKVSALKAEIKALQQTDYNKYATALKAAEVAPLLFSGSYEALSIEEGASLSFQDYSVKE